MKKLTARWFLICLAILALAMSQAVAQSTAKQPPSQKAAPASAGAVYLDINTASEAELKALPGIGDAYASKIIAGRPYQNRNQLLQRKIIPAATYNQIKSKIIAKQNSALKK
jgi:competence protein ComEA